MSEREQAVLMVICGSCGQRSECSVHMAHECDISAYELRARVAALEEQLKAAAEREHLLRLSLQLMSQHAAEDKAEFQQQLQERDTELAAIQMKAVSDVHDLAVDLETAKAQLTSERAITVNILRSWDRAKIQRFALHLLGDAWQTTAANVDDLVAEIASLKAQLEEANRNLKRYSFAFGNANIENPAVTRQMVRMADLERELAEAKAEVDFLTGRQGTLLSVISGSNARRRAERAKLTNSEREVARLREAIRGDLREIENWVGGNRLHRDLGILSVIDRRRRLLNPEPVQESE